MPPDMDEMEGGRSPFDGIRSKPKSSQFKGSSRRFGVTRLISRLPLPVRLLVYGLIAYLCFVGVTQTWNTVIPHYEHCDMCFQVVDKWYVIRMSEGWNPVSILMNQEERPEPGKHAAYTLCEDCFKVWESSFRYYRLHDTERKAVLGK